MSIDEPTRHELFTWFAARMPEHLAEAMMNSIPPTGWGDIVTRRDLAATSSELRGEMTELRADMTALRAELRGQMAELRAELHGDVAELRAELHGDAALLRGEMAGLAGAMDLAISGVHRTVVLSAIAMAVSTWGMTLAAIGLS